MWALFCLVALAAADDAVLYRAAPATPEGWYVHDHLPSRSDRLEVRIALNNRNWAAFEDLVLQISNPQSTKYGQFMNADQIADMVGPTKATLATVTAWLDATQVKYSVGAHKDIILVDLSVAECEALFRTTVHSISSADGKQKTFRAGDLYVPANVAENLYTIMGLHGLPLPDNELTIRPKKMFGPADVTPTVIQDVYNITGTPSGNVKARQAVAEFQSQYIKPDDVTTFFKKFVPKAKSGEDQIYKFVGKNNPSGSGVEAALDVEYIMGVSQGIKTEFWSWPQFQFCSDLVAWSEAMFKDSDVPLVHSVSYGFQGPITQLCHMSDVSTVDAEFVKLAAKGISIIFASGDSGSSYMHDGGSAKLYPSWPASSAWVTAVGATRFIDQKPHHGEMATDQFGSGGGFSWFLSQPSWQTSVVHNYLTVTGKNLPPANEFNASGRATPDVSALGEGFQVVDNGRTMSVGGTSASAPTFASVVARLNDMRITNGKHQLGFLNPWIYSTAFKAFRDVVEGTNAISRGGSKFPAGYDCVKGWDPATGFGTPDFAELVKYI